MSIKTTIGILSSFYKGRGFMDAVNLVKGELKARVTAKLPFRGGKYPSEITVEIMNVCNLSCSHCYLTAQKEFRPEMLKYDDFVRIIDRISPMIKKARLFNCSSVEALFHKRFFDMTDIVKSINPHINIIIQTNGMLLNDENIDKILKRDIDRIAISLDGCRKETVEGFKTGVDFDIVTTNIKRLKEKSKGRIIIGVIFVAHKGNINELLDYIDFCKDLGVTAIFVTGFISYSSDTSDICLYSKTGMKDVDEIFRKAKSKAEWLGINLTYKSTKLEAKGCHIWDTMYIDMNADMVPCVLYSRETSLRLKEESGATTPIVWGNILRDDPYKIWTSNVCIDFRKSIHSGRLPANCSLCAIGYNVICG